MERDEKLVFILIVIIAVILRFLFLTERPMHHDESVHAYLAYWIYKYFSYTYDPAFHGPFLYYSTAFMFYLFGDSEFIARLLPALTGVALVILPLFLRNFIGRSYLYMSLLLAISPSFVYYSRFLRNDIFVSFFVLSAFISYMYYRNYRSQLHGSLAVLFMALAFSSKENAFIYAFIFLSFIAGYGLYKNRLRYFRDLFESFPVFLPGILLSAVLLVVLYSSFFTHPEVLRTAIPDSISHWVRMHEVKDHYKPPYYYFALLLRYEFLIFLAGCAGIVYKLKRKTDGVFWWFVIYWAILSFIVYTYLSHKVPWLLLHLLLPLSLTSAIVLQKLSEGRARYVVFALVAITLILTINVNFVNYENDKEGLVYVQTKSETLNLVNFLKTGVKNGTSVMISEPESDYWPLPWYLRDYRVGYSIKLPDEFHGLLVVSERNVEKAIKKYGERPVTRYEIRPGHYLYLLDLR